MDTNKDTLQQFNRFMVAALDIETRTAQEAGALGFMARAMVQCSLPHRRTQGNEFTRTNGAYTLSLLAPSAIGLPYGTVPRLLLSWMATEALRTKSRELVLGDNLSAFMRALEMVPTGGRWGSIARLREQSARLFASTVSCSFVGDMAAGERGFRLADASLWWQPKQPGQSSLWESTVTVSEQFYRAIIEHPVPIDMRALRALRKSPLALDLYCWLTHRMHSLNRQIEIPWAALAAQFGSEYARVRDFKVYFRPALRKVHTVYSAARIAEGRHGLILRPSPTHVAVAVSEVLPALPLS